MRRSDAIDELRRFCALHFMDYRLGEDENLFSLGFVSSMFALQLVEFVEEAFRIALDDEDLDIDNFSTLGAIADLVERKERASRAA